MYSFSCQICGVDMAIARMRTPNEPPSAAWDYTGADYVGFSAWPCQNEFEDQDCQHCTTKDRGPAKPPDLSAWPDQDDQDDVDWAPDGHSLNGDSSLECDSGQETEDSESGHEHPSRSDDASRGGEMDSHDADDSTGQHPLRDLWASPLPERLPHGTWHNGYAYYAGNRKQTHILYLPNAGSPNVPPEHIASSSCQSFQGINGHVLSVAQMKNCRNVRFLVHKPTHWTADASDQIFEASSTTLFCLSGESNGSNMNESNYFRPWHSLYPPRHGVKEICTSWEYIGEGCNELEELLTPLPVHSYCLDLYAKSSFRRLGYVDLNGLWHWREMRSDPDSYGVAGRIPRQRPELERARESWDYPWRHIAGDEWLVANPVEIPDIDKVLKTCAKYVNISKHAQRSGLGFLVLPPEVIQHTLSFLDMANVDNMAKTCRTLYKPTQSAFAASVARDMPWLWEVIEDSEYPVSRDCPPTWDPLCPLGTAPPTLPVGLENEEDEEARWADIIAEDPEMEEIGDAIKTLNRMRRDEVLAPYRASLKISIDEWHNFRANVEAWIRRRPGNVHYKGEMNWRRLWLLFNPTTSPLQGIRNRARIWEGCEQILDCVALAHKVGEIDKKHDELRAKISDISGQISYAMPDTRPDIPDWIH